MLFLQYILRYILQYILWYFLYHEMVYFYVIFCCFYSIFYAIFLCYILMYFYIMFLRCFLYHEMSYLTLCYQMYWVWVVSTVLELFHYHFDYIRRRVCFVFLEPNPLVECYSSSVIPNYMQFCFFLLTVTYEECLLEE